jgi:hypothetical protein
LKTLNLDALLGSRAPRDAFPLTSLLPYLMCGRVQDLEPVHFLDDGALGFAVEFDIPAVDTQVGSEEIVSGFIDQALRALPPEVDWQWFVRISPHVGSQLQLYLAQTSADPIARICASQYAQRWFNAQREGFFPDDPSINFYPRSQSILIALKSQPVPAVRPAFTPILVRRDRSNALVSAFIEAARSLQSLLATHGINNTVVGADELANWIADLLFPWRRFDHPTIHTGLHSTREAIASLGRIDSLELRGFRSVSGGAEAHHRVVSMLWHPRAVRAGMTNVLMQLRPHLCVSLTARALPTAVSTLRLKAQGLLNARSSNRFNEVESEARAEALRDVEQRLFAEGERLIEGRVHVHLIERSADAAENAARTVCNCLRDLDIEAALEEDIGSSLILRGCLPFAIYEATERNIRRRRRFLSRDFADLHPAGGCWTGIAPSREGSQAPLEPVVMYSNSLGQALFLDPSKAERNPHALVVGQSGSGKSFFVHDYLLHLWRLPDLRLYLISIKPDYRKLALLLGRYVELNLDTADSLNPFVGPPTLENQARWLAALTLMITEGRPDTHLSRQQEILMQERLLAASAPLWDAERGRAAREMQLEDVCVELERSGPVGRDLAFRLLPYRRGPFRRLFNRPRTLGADDRFIFFNLGNILRHSCSAAASFCVFTLIDQVMHDPALRAIPKGLVADEVWALVQDPFAAAILERSLKAYRSLGAFALPIVQDPRDLDSPAGRVILVNTATKIILPMDRSGQDEISRFVRLNDRELDLVRNLRLVKRRYSEFFVSIEGIHSAKGLVIPDPLRYAISTTDPADEAELDRMYRDGGDMLQAVRKFALEMPFGVRAATLALRPHGLIRWTLLIYVFVATLAVATAWILLSPRTRSLTSATPETLIADREHAAEEAARLLTTSSSLSRQKAVPSDPYNPEPNASPAEASAFPRFQRPPESDEKLEILAKSLRTLSDTSNVDRSSAALPNAESLASTGGATEKRSRPRQPIPDRIEDASSKAGGDPLHDLSLQSTLVTIESAAFPWALVEIHIDDNRASARFASSEAPSQPDPGWFEPGDSLATGWMLVGVEDDSATLLSADGNLVHLQIPALLKHQDTEGP